MSKGGQTDANTDSRVKWSESWTNSCAEVGCLVCENICCSLRIKNHHLIRWFLYHFQTPEKSKFGNSRFTTFYGYLENESKKTKKTWRLFKKCSRKWVLEMTPPSCSLFSRSNQIVFYFSSKTTILTNTSFFGNQHTCVNSHYLIVSYLCYI